jgi:hypothetical protein
MLYQLSQLNTEERELIYDAPVWVSIYVALADNRIKKEERKKIVETVHTKTFSEKNDLSEMYKELKVNIESRIQLAIDQIPVFQEEKEPFVREKLVAVNSAMKKLDKVFARQLYKSLKDFAVITAQASGGVLGVNRINETEKGLLNLDMIEQP